MTVSATASPALRHSEELICQFVDCNGGEDPVELPPHVARLDARVPIIC